MNHQRFVERTLWELHKSPRNQLIDYALGTPRDNRIFDKMVEDGTIVRDFRFRGFPNRSMEKPTIPMTVPWQEDRNHNEQTTTTTTVWVRGYRQDPDRDRGVDGLVYGEQPVDNTPRRRGRKKFPVDPGLDSYLERKRQEQMMTERYRSEYRRDRDNGERETHHQLRSPLRESRQGGRYQNGYHPEDSQYQPSFGQGNQGQTTREYYSSRREIISPGRETWGIPVTDFIRHDEFEDHINQGHSGRDPQVNRGGPSSPRRGVPVTEFMKHEEYETHHAHHGSSGANSSPFNRAGVSSPPRDARGIPVLDFVKHDADADAMYHMTYDHTHRDQATNREGATSPRRGIPVTDFIKHDEFDDPTGLSGGRPFGGRGYRLPDEPLYDPFGRSGGGAPVVDSTGRKRTTVFGNFEKKNDPREVERDMAAKSRMKEDLSRGMQEQRNKRNQDIEYHRKPETDLADLMRRKEVGRPRVDPTTGTPSDHQHLPLSDVSRSKMNYQPRNGRETEQYRRFLQDQIEERERSRLQDKQRQRHEADQHFATFDSQWGHWGGGAPKDGKEHRKLKLEESIHRRPDSQREGPWYRKNYYEREIRQMPGDATPRFVKNTVKSNHRNFYQVPLNGWVESTSVRRDVTTPRYVRNTINSSHTNYYQYPANRYQTNAPYATGYSYGI